MAGVSSPLPVVSLVVATFGDDGSLGALLTSWKHAARPEVELLIVDQNLDDRVTDAISAAQLPSALSPVHLKVSWQNASRARNLGGAAARGEWLGFPDDDCRLPGDSARRLLDALHVAAAHSAVVVTGRIVDDRGEPHMRHWPDSSRFFCLSLVDRCAIEATTFLRRDVFLQVGGFDPSFGPGGRFHAAEGNELLARLQSTRPWIGWYDVDLILEHPRRPPAQGRDAALRSWRYAYGAGAAWGRFPLSPLARFSAVAIVQSLGALLLRRPELWASADRVLRAAGIITGFLRASMGYHLFRRGKSVQQQGVPAQAAEERERPLPADLSVAPYPSTDPVEVADGSAA